MKTPFLIIALTFAAACTPQDERPTTGTEVDAEAPATSPELPLPVTQEPPATVQANGVVEEVSVDAGTVTIAHEAIDAYEWPPMTMTFAAPGVDLSGIRPGEPVTFELTRTGAMEGTVTSISSIQPEQ
ncbi:MAG: copper-binding protein [Pseudomonadota bacterium]|nr:copper-binding protein [Pseudomonadota bacterium]